MKKIYLYILNNISVIGLIALGVPAQAKLYQPNAINPKQVMTVKAVSTAASTTLIAEASIIAAPEVLPANVQMVQAVERDHSQRIADTQLVPMATLETQFTSVSQLSDVQPTDWAFQALQSLIDRYHCLADYSDQTFGGNRTLTRYEFAAGINACLNKISKQVGSMSTEELKTLKQLQAEFAAELTTLQERVDVLEAENTELAANQFSTTTKLLGRLVTAVTGGSFSGERIIAPTGVEIAKEDPNATFIYRLSLDFDTSFSRKDLLKIKLTAGSDGAEDHIAGLLEPNFGSALDFSIAGRKQFAVTRLYYSFTPVKDLKLTLGPRIVAFDFVDKNSYANVSFLDFSTQALIFNLILFPRPAGAGGVLEWNPREGSLTVRALYVAVNGASFNSENTDFFDGPRAPEFLFPPGGGDPGLFGDYQAIAELEYSPSDTFTLRLQYNDGSVLGSPLETFGVNFELALSPRFAIFGRYGYSNYNNTPLGIDLHPNYWMAGVSFQDLFVPGALAGIAAGQPFIEKAIGDATQTNFEAFYNFPLNDNIQITPIVQVISNSSNQGSNGTIVTGTLRTVFSF